MALECVAFSMALGKTRHGWSFGIGELSEVLVDSWLPLHDNLLEVAREQIPQHWKDLTVDTFTDQDRDWNWKMYIDMLPNNSLLAIASTVPPSQERDTDQPFWEMDSQGVLFLVKSAYELIMKEKWSAEAHVWKLIGSWPWSQCIWSFLWLVRHGNLLTNELIVRRSFAALGTCLICNTGSEPIPHALWDCHIVKVVWQELGAEDVVGIFSLTDTQQRLIRNPPCSHMVKYSIPWNFLFRVASWRFCSWGE